MSAHTPGPWIRREWTRHALTTVGIADPLVFGGFRIVAECERVEDAQLVEAAPKLLAVLEVVVENWTQQFERAGHMAPTWCKQAREAIAAARGAA